MKRDFSAVSLSKKMLFGGMVGGINGLFGGGGGMVAVPALRTFFNCSDKSSHATAIAVIAPVCFFGAIPYIYGGYFQASLVVPCAVGVVLGGMVGAKILNKLPAKFVRFAFIVITLVSGVRMIL